MSNDNKDKLLLIITLTLLIVVIQITYLRVLGVHVDELVPVVEA